VKLDWLRDERRQAALRMKWATTLIAACAAKLTPKQFKAACDEATQYLQRGLSR